MDARIRVTVRDPSEMPEDSPVTDRSARVAEAFLDQAETSVAERDWDRALTLVGYVKRLDAENADASALRNLIESRQHSGPGEAFTGTLPSNLVQALDPGNAEADSLEQPAESRAPVESEAGVVTATSDSRKRLSCWGQIRILGPAREKLFSLCSTRSSSRIRTAP